MAAPSPKRPRVSSTSDTQSYTCITCVQRKVKCDKRQPCFACEKSKLLCQYRTTPPPPRRKKKVTGAEGSARIQNLLSRIRSYESLLSTAGISFDVFEIERNASLEHDKLQDEGHDDEAGDELELDTHSDLPVEQSPSADVARVTMSSKEKYKQVLLFPRQRGILIPEFGGQRYYEHGLIGNLSQQYRQVISSKTRVALPVQSGEPNGQPVESLEPSLCTHIGLPKESPRCQHPPASTIAMYWRFFMERIHPLTMIIHAPSMHNILFDVSMCTQSSSDRMTDPLRFSIYACAVASLTEDESRKTFGHSKASLLFSLQSTARDALLGLSFFQVPNLDLLRAYVLLITSMLHTTDNHTIWIMLGTVIRMARSQGLHRDGVILRLKPFDTEMRRRLWWYISTLDNRLSEILGLESTMNLSEDTILPSNLDDGDISPDMITPASEHVGTSDMTFSLVKYEITRFQQENDPRLESRSDLPPLSSSDKVSSLEKLLEEKYIRFCDPVVPVQLLTTVVMRSSICRFKQMLLRRQSYASNLELSDSSLQQQIYKNILNLSTRVISYDSFIHRDPSLSGFFWHTDFYFSWGSPIFILKILASVQSVPDWDSDMLAAWAQIEEMHRLHPEFLTPDSQRSEHRVVADLTLNAWNAREEFLISNNCTSSISRVPLQIPAVVDKLRQHQKKDRSKSCHINLHDLQQQRKVGNMMDCETEINNDSLPRHVDFYPANSPSFEFNILDTPLEDMSWSGWDIY